MKTSRKIALAILCISFILTSCGNTEDSHKKTKEENTTNSEQLKKTEDDYYISYNGKNIYILEEIENVVEILGQDYEYFETASCAFDGMDKFYYYNNITVMTNDIDGKELVTDMYFTNDAMGTPEGVRIGNDYAKVIDVYGSDYDMNGTAMEYMDGNTIFTIDIAEGKVSAIEYGYK